MNKIAVTLLLILSPMGLMAETTHTLKIKGMTCGSCVKAIKETLCKEKGVKSCEVEIGSAKITLDEKANLKESDFKALLKKAGGFELESLTNE